MSLSNNSQQMPRKLENDWSRSTRVKLKLKKSAEQCSRIDDFFTPCDIQTTIQKNKELQLQVELLQSKLQGFESDQESLSTLLSCLVDAAKENYSKRKGGERYSYELKLMARYMFQLGGPKLYNVLKSNMPHSLPSISTLKRFYSLNSTPLSEGEFRFLELRNFLLTRGYPLKIWISEDGTRISSKIQYNGKSNQLVGFVAPLNDQGLPEIGAFPASSAKEIKHHFETSCLSNYAYLINAQPLSDKAAVFCLCMFGTDNKFEGVDVVNRSKWMCKVASEYGIEVVGMSADGDPRLLQAMQSFTFYDSETNEHQKWTWFVGPYEVLLISVEDHVHVGTKMRTRLLSPSVVLPVGDYIISPSHIKELIETISKDQHNLTLCDLNSTDKMNFRAIEKMFQPNVVKLLKENVHGSNGTIEFLNMTREVLSSYMDKTVSPEQRLFWIWKWIFFLRAWRKWLCDNGYSLQDNFISNNAYLCIEINGHSLIRLIRYCRDTPNEGPRSFLPWLCSSQPCEKSFRATRSLSTVQNTVVNFSVLELQHRFQRIELQAETELVLGGKFTFPSAHRSSKLPEQTAVFYDLPDDSNIEQTVLKSQASALHLVQTLGMDLREIPDPNFTYSYFVEPDLEEEEGFFPSTEDPGPVEDCISADSDESDLEDDSLDIEEDLCIVSSGPLAVKTFQDVDLSPKSIYCKVLDGNGLPAIIKKSTLCYLFSEAGTKLSSDRLLRVQAPEHKPRSKHSLNSGFGCEDEINEGDWCVFATSDFHSFLVGRVLAFGFLNKGKSKKQLQCSKSSVPVKAENGREIGCLCSWFSLQEDSSLSINSTFSHGFYNTSFYICTIPRPSMKNGVLWVTQATHSQIKSMFSSFCHKN